MCSPVNDDGMFNTCSLDGAALSKRLRAEGVVSVLNRVVARRRTPRFLFADNGSGLSGRLRGMWA